MTFPPRARIPFLVLGALCGLALQLTGIRWDTAVCGRSSALWSTYSEGAGRGARVSAALTCLLGAPGVLAGERKPRANA